MKTICTLLLLFILLNFIKSQNPLLIAPADIVVSCRFKFTESDLLDSRSTLFGNVVFDSTQRKKVITTDIVCHKMCEADPSNEYPGNIPGNPNTNTAADKACFYYNLFFDSINKERQYNLDWGEEGFVINPLENRIEITIIDNRKCHQGRILRIFSTLGPNNTEVKDTQNIWVLNCSPFTFNPELHGKSIVISGCSVPPPDSTQRPNLPDDSCSSLSINYIDSIDVRDPEYFFIVFRQWEFIDHCQYDPSSIPVKGRWTYQDTIYVLDHIAPKNTIKVQDCKTADSTGFGMIHVAIDYKDNCTAMDWIYCEYSIDLFNDGMGTYNGFDLKVGPLNQREYKLGLKPTFSDNPYSTFMDNPQNASGNYPVGRHKVLFETKDGLGNLAKDSIYFTIFQKNNPKFECPIKDFDLKIELPKTYVISIPELLFTSQDHCSPYSDFKVTLDENMNKPIDIINCQDYFDNGQSDILRRTYKVRIQDALGNPITCSVNIQYNFEGNCDSLNTNYFRGYFYNLNGKEIEDLDLQINSTFLGQLNLSTGCINFFAISTKHLDTSITCNIKRQDAAVNGVDVLDIMLIWRHILGLENIENKLSILAADVNNNKSLTTKDINELEKQILGTGSNQLSLSDAYWKFYNKTDTSIITSNSIISESENQFIGIKTGDVNGNALSKCNEERIKRTPCLNLTHGMLDLQKGKSYLIPIFCPNYTDIFGLQATFQFDPKILRLDTILPGQLVGMKYNLDLSLKNTGRFSILYYPFNGSAESIAGNIGLFILKLTALENYLGNDFLKAIDDPTYSIAYDKDEHPLDICVNGIPTKLNEIGNVEFLIYPNPIKGDINIQLPDKNTEYSLKIYNVYGQTVYSDKCSTYSNSEISLSEKCLKEPGAYYVTLHSRDKTYHSVLIRQ